jgi:hypothetical protein
MRANRSLCSSPVVVLLAAMSGCSADDAGPKPAAAPELPTSERAPVAPTEPAPQPPLGPAPSQAELNELLRQVESVRAGTQDAQSLDDLVPQPPRRLVFQCTDDVTFAVRMLGARLEVYPPGISRSFIVLSRQPTDSGLLYTARDALFRSDDDLATLEVGRERWVDCVSNPAATVWEEPPRPGTVTR